MPIVDCPICGRGTEFTRDIRYRPFCSERCWLIDLSHWGTDGYVIPGDPPDPDAPGDASGPGSPRID